MELNLFGKLDVESNILGRLSRVESERVGIRVGWVT